MSQFFLSVLYAKPYQIGWDPSMSVVPDGSDSPQYDVTVESVEGATTVFRTVELLSGERSKSVLDKSTRVWKAVRLQDGVPSGSTLR